MLVHQWIQGQHALVQLACNHNLHDDDDGGGDEDYNNDDDDDDRQ